MADMELVLIPCSGRLWLAYPECLVGRFYPYAPLLSVENGSEFVAGAMLVQNEKLPVLNFTFEKSEKNYDGLLRIVLISTIKNLKLQHYAIVSYGEPKKVSVSEGRVRSDGPGDHPYISQYIIVNEHEQKRIAILDLPKFEDDLRM